MTKFGVLWLVDLLDRETMKVLSLHDSNGEINKCICDDLYIVTGGKDGNVYETSLTNLEQTSEIYKPRRSVNDIVFANEMVAVAFSHELYFYTSNYEYIGNVVMS